MHLGPTPDDYNQFLPDPTHDPHVARCLSCGKRYTVDQYNTCPQDENITRCTAPSCGGEVEFI